MPDQKDEFLLKIENLHAYYTSKSGIVKAVNDVSFYIREGESVGLFGESGAGKTSIALAILGIFDRFSKFYATASGEEEIRKLWEKREKAKKEGKTSEDYSEELPGVEGKILYRGKDLLKLDEKEYRKIRGNEIAYIPQGTRKAMNPFTGIDIQTAESLWAHDEDDVLTERQVLVRVLEVLDLVELADVDARRHLKPSEFSVGEDQRILIAMALVTLPVLLIADEPTTAVDVAVQHRILEAIRMAQKELKLSLLMISNDQGVIAETSDRVAVMSAGRIMEFGDAEVILKRPDHPFTRAFIMSNPPMELLRKIREKGMKVRGIPGSPPDLANPPPGCPFNPRCEYCIDICKEEIPEYREVEPGHWVLCHRYGELPDFSL